MSGRHQRIGILALGAVVLATLPLSAQAQTKTELDQASTALKDARRDCRIGEAKLVHDEKQLAAQAARWFRDLKQAERRLHRKPRKGQDPAHHRLLVLSVLAGLSDKGKTLAREIEDGANAVAALNKRREDFAKQVWAFEFRLQTQQASPVLSLDAAAVEPLDAGRDPSGTIRKAFEAQELKLGSKLRVIAVTRSQSWILQDLRKKRTYYLQRKKDGAVAVFADKTPRGKKVELTPAQKVWAKEKKRRLKKLERLKRKHIATLKRLAALQGQARTLAKAVAKAAGRHTWRVPGTPR